MVVGKDISCSVNTDMKIGACMRDLLVGNWNLEYESNTSVL